MYHRRRVGPSCEGSGEDQRQHDSRYFDSFQTIAEAVNSAHSLYELKVVQQSEIFPRYPSGLTALANALQEHTALEEFTWLDWFSPLAPLDLSLDPVLLALPACPHLRKVTMMTKFASIDTTKNLLQLRPATCLFLVLETEQWLAVADEIRQGRCNVQTLTLRMLRRTISEATKAAKAVASAIRLDHNLRYLTLPMENGFTDEAGVALAEALAVNETLRKISLSVHPVVANESFPNTDELGAPSYEASSAMLRVNTSTNLEFPPFPAHYAGGDRGLLGSRNQMVIEMQLNRVGRGRLLASSQTTREEYVVALHELNSNRPSPAFKVCCLYSLLRLCPAVCMS
jgi:hypothetical protein